MIRGSIYEITNNVSVLQIYPEGEKIKEEVENHEDEKIKEEVENHDDEKKM